MSRTTSFLGVKGLVVLDIDDSPLETVLSKDRPGSEVDGLREGPQRDQSVFYVQGVLGQTLTG